LLTIIIITLLLGTIAGAIEAEDIQTGQAIYDGVASGAKLVFIDLGIPCAYYHNNHLITIIITPYY
jgi:hypothetical protein